MHLGDFRNSASSKPDRTKTLEGDGEQPCHETPEHFFICSLIFKESTLAAQIAKTRPSQTIKHIFPQTKKAKNKVKARHFNNESIGMTKKEPLRIFSLVFLLYSHGHFKHVGKFVCAAVNPE